MPPLRPIASRSVCAAASLLVLGLLALGAPAPVAAQDSPLILELRGGMAVPLGSFRDGTAIGEGSEPGPSLSVLYGVRRSRRQMIYLGFSPHRFDCEPIGCPSDTPLVATGFNVGMRVALLPGRTIGPWLRAGLVTMRVETDGLPDPDAGVSSLGLGAEAGAGLHIRLGSVLAFTPAVAYSALNSKLPGGTDLGLRYLTTQFGVALSF